jgi:VWFA-related protein
VRRRLPLVTAVLVLLLGGAMGAYQGAWAQFKDETTVVVVEVPVHVIRDGEPVRDLTRDDFVIFDGRKKQDLIGFEVIDLAEYGVAPEQKKVTEIPSSGRRHFLLLFDLSLSTPEAIVRARISARRLIREGLHPADLAAVATYTESRGAELVLNFTPNREQVEVALETLGLAQPAAAIEDPLSLIISDLDAQGGGDEGGGSRGDQLLAEMVRDFKTTTGRVARDQQKNRVLALSESMANLAGLMNSIDGRKHVVFMSAGFDSQILTGVDNMQRQMEINDASTSGENWNIDSTERFGDSYAASALERMLVEFQRADCAIQAVDIGGVQAGPDANTRSSRNEGLFRMARETGGEFYQNYNEVDVAIGKVLERTSVTYLLAFQPRNLKLDDKFHKLRIELKTDIKGARLVHRPGYYPPKPFAQQSATERQLSTASTILSGSSGGQFLTSVLSVPFPDPGEKAYLPVLIEIDGKSFLGGSSGDVLATEIYAYALDEQGQVKDFFARRLGLDVEKTGDTLRAGGFKYWGHLDLDPGEYVLRVLVRNGVTGESSLSVMAVTVPDFAAGASSLLPVLFPEPPNIWVLGMEPKEEQRADVDFPFIMRDQGFLPAARPVLGTAGQTVSLAGYYLGEGSLRLQSQFFAADGTPVGEGEIELIERSPSTVPGFERLIVNLKPGKIPQGEYLLMVTVTDLASGQENSSTTPVVVSG